MQQEQTLYWPAAMLQQILDEATRLDRSLSWCIQTAWDHARGEIARLAPQDDHPVAQPLMASFLGGEKRKQSLFFSEETLREIEDEATRHDRSLSWIVECAWCLSIEHLAAMSAQA